MKKNYVLYKSLRSSLIKVLVLYFVILSFKNETYAQGWDALTNPTVYVEIKNPPQLGLIINKVIFNYSEGGESDLIMAGVINQFVSKGVEVIDRENLKKILEEQNFSYSGFVDKTTAISIGKIIGPSALITVKVLRFTSNIQDNLYQDVQLYNYDTKKYYNARKYIARTSVNLQVSIQTTDLTTGKIFAAETISTPQVLDSESYTGRPQAPSVEYLRTVAVDEFLLAVSKLFFPYTTGKSLYFMNDKAAGLKEAYKALESRNIDLAFDLSKKSVEICLNSSEIKDKIKAHALYNLGMMYFIKGEYDNAITYLNESKKIRPGDIVDESIQNCEKARNKSLLMKKIDENAAIELQKNQERAKEIQQSIQKSTLTNKDIIELTEKKLPTNLIIQKIKTSKCIFDISTEELVKLSKLGIAEEVIVLMMEISSKSN